MVVLIGLEDVTHISNLDFLLIWDPTVLPYPLSYFELESLESLYSWQCFFATVVLIGLEEVTHISNLDFLLLRDPTVLPYPLSYSKSESLAFLLS